MPLVNQENMVEVLLDGSADIEVGFLFVVMRFCSWALIIIHLLKFKSLCRVIMILYLSFRNPLKAQWISHDSTFVRSKSLSIHDSISLSLSLSGCWCRRLSASSSCCKVFLISYFPYVAVNFEPVIVWYEDKVDKEGLSQGGEQVDGAPPPHPQRPRRRRRRWHVEPSALGRLHRLSTSTAASSSSSSLSSSLSSS